MEMYEILKENPKIWEHFSKKEEYFPKKIDSHGRFTYANSAYKDIFEPQVSKYLLQKGFKVEYPNKKKFAVCLTHDIDDIYPPLRHLILSSFCCLKELNFNDLSNQISWKLNKKKSPYINFKEIMQLEEKYDAKSSFYFITAKEDVRRFRYDVRDVKDELGVISDSGWEVGLHGGYYSYNDFNEIVKEKTMLENVLGQKIIGFRNHYLRFKVPNSWELLSNAGFKYDTTFGYEDMIGFRNGMCHPFRPYNLSENREIDILEIPLVIMDGSLFEITNTLEEAWKHAKYLIDIVEKYNGVITILWHNNVFSCPFRHTWKIIYEKILKYCHEKDAWMTHGKDICEWWSHEY
jgi:peptidoglycan/xylan/chitin deacetylase (PgdA/CDA1 family)